MVGINSWICAVRLRFLWILLGTHRHKYIDCVNACNSSKLGLPLDLIFGLPSTLQFKLVFNSVTNCALIWQWTARDEPFTHAQRHACRMWAAWSLCCRGLVDLTRAAAAAALRLFGLPPRPGQTAATTEIPTLLLTTRTTCTSVYSFVTLQIWGYMLWVYLTKQI